MIPVHPKANCLKLRRALLLIILPGILSTVSCHSEPKEKNGHTGTAIQKLQRQLTDLKYREKALQQENVLARKPEPYLLVDLTNPQVELKAKGRVLRAFKVKRLKRELQTIPDTARALLEVKPIQKTERPKIKPGEGEEATAEALEKNLWGLHRMPQDYDLVLQDGMILEIRALPSEQTGMATVKLLKTLYRKTLDWYRHATSSETAQPQTVQLWLDENDARLLFWSLPKQLKILIVPI